MTFPLPPVLAQALAPANEEGNHQNNNNNEAGGDFGAGFGAGGSAGDMGHQLTWERIFGLDGTMTFLEHALWLIAMNIFFILIFGERLWFRFR